MSKIVFPPLPFSVDCDICGQKMKRCKTKKQRTYYHCSNCRRYIEYETDELHFHFFLMLYADMEEYFEAYLKSK